MIVIRNPARMKKTPAWLRYGIALLKEHTRKHAIIVVMIYVTNTCQAWKT